jgi:hypothetical protein
MDARLGIADGSPWIFGTPFHNLEIRGLTFCWGTIGAGLALLGPGAWSVDARLFGWKRIDVRDRKS